MAVTLDKSPLADAAGRLRKELPAPRVESLNGSMSVTPPPDGKYPDPQRFKRGQSVPVPESVGITLDLSVDTLLDGD